MERKKLTIGLFGFGCVGTGLYETLRSAASLNAEIKKICVKNRNKQRSLPAENFCYDSPDLLNDPSINTIVELIDDADAAFEIVSTALKKGKAVVSANKKMIAKHLPELIRLQRKYQVPLLYEASCCASIPVIRNLEEYFDNELLSSLRGIVNGSTNYILSKTNSEGLAYGDALRQAQQLGFAESDPRLDTEGHDPAFKLTILTCHAFGLVAEPDSIFRIGIDRLDGPELSYAREKGFRIRLVAQAARDRDGRVTALVMPAFVPKEDKLFEVNDVYNAIQLQSNLSDQQFFCGKGAGAFPTASAVLSDLSALTYDYRYEYKKLNKSSSLASPGNIRLKILLRCKPDQALALSGYFETLSEYNIREDSSWLIGNISLEKLARITRNFPGTSAVLFEVIPETSTNTQAQNQPEKHEISYK